MRFDVIVMFFVFGLVESVGLEHMSVHANNLALVGMHHLQGERDFGLAKTKNILDELITMVAPMRGFMRVFRNVFPELLLELPHKLCAVIVQANATMLELVEQNFLVMPPIKSFDCVVAIDVGLPTCMD